MAFYSADPAMGQTLVDLVRALELEGRPGLGSQISITWLCYGQSLAKHKSHEDLAPKPEGGASWRGDQLREPASLVNLIYLAACEAWLHRQLISEDPGLRRAMAAMVQPSRTGYGATSLIVDLLSGTTSGPSLPHERFGPWKSQRQLVNQWLQTLGWPELVGWNACQKTWVDGPYGRELDFHSADQGKPNLVTTDGMARLLESVMAGTMISPPACRRMRTLLERSSGHSTGSTTGLRNGSCFMKAGLPPKAQLWSQAGRQGEAKHEAAYLEIEGSSPMLLVVQSEGERCSVDEELLPEIAGRLMTYNAMTSRSSV